MNWIWRNKQWLFSGICIFFLLFVCRRIIVPLTYLLSGLHLSGQMKWWLFSSIGISCFPVVFRQIIVPVTSRLIVPLTYRLSRQRKSVAPAAPAPLIVRLPLNRVLTKLTLRDIGKRIKATPPFR